MASIWIDDSIMNLRLPAGETMLFARICYRAAIHKSGNCCDSNRELAEAVNQHTQTVSDLIRKMEKNGLLTTKIDKSKANARCILPIRNFLTPYKEKADSYKEKTDSDYKEKTYTLSGNSLDPISEILTPSKEIPYSYNKDKELLENLRENPIKTDSSADASLTPGASDELIDSLSTPPAETAPTTPSSAAPPPPPQIDDPAIEPTPGPVTLRQACLTYHEEHPDAYKPAMYKAFLAYWTAPVQNGKKSEIGKELWQTQKTWNLAGRLANWHSRDEQPSQTNGRKSTAYLATQRAAEPAKGGYGTL